MRNAVYSDVVVKLATVKQAVERYKLSRNTIMKLATNEDAVRHFGRSVRIDVEKLDKAIEAY